MSELTQAIADTLPDWSRETMEYKHDIVATIVKRLMDGGMSETAIRNMLVNYKQAANQVSFSHVASLRKQLERAKACGNQTQVNDLVGQIAMLKLQFNSEYGPVTPIRQPTVTGTSPEPEDGLPTA